MKDHNIIKEFEDKNVEVFTTFRANFSGTLRFDVSRGLLTLTPIDKYVKERYGQVIIDQDFVVAIREVLPQPNQPINCCEDDCESAG